MYTNGRGAFNHNMAQTVVGGRKSKLLGKKEKIKILHYSKKEKVFIKPDALI